MTTEEIKRNYDNGVADGLNQAAGILLEDAVEYFRLSRDDVAEILRGQANSLSFLSAKSRPIPDD